MSPRPRNTQIRREQIARAALEVIAERGFQELRVADVAARAGTSASAVHYHFASKDEILDAAVSQAEDAFYAEIEAAVRESEPAGHRLVRLLERGSLGPSEERSIVGWRVWLEIWTRALRDRHTARTRELFDRRWRWTLAAAIRDGQANGEFSPAADPEEVSLQLAALMDGLAILWVLGDTDVDGSRMTSLLVLTAEQSLDCELQQYLQTHSRRSQA
ncbi:MAG TPA: TetR family transcriptional regulator C-terminal domain-containing protein [Solirubrobacteraceae bacterium]|nr:TetR family transcriptional regulator C-terminal domain-containing protein [Solirubrobacteraceae bacterium]